MGGLAPVVQGGQTPLVLLAVLPVCVNGLWLSVSAL